MQQRLAAFRPSLPLTLPAKYGLIVPAPKRGAMDIGTELHRSTRTGAA